MTILDAIRAGIRIYDLAHPLVEGMPTSPSHPEFRMALLRRHGDRPRGDGLTGANELISMGGHVGTHVDALAHIACDGRLHGGVDAAAASHGGRFKVHGIDAIAPIVCRGVLLDVAKAAGVDQLDAGYGIGPEDLEAAAAGMDIARGDVVLVRTGWARRYHDRDAFIGHESGVPGPTVEAALWLAGKGVLATGADTVAYEQLHPGAGHSNMPVHRTLLVEHGINIIEALVLERLSRDGIREFCFVLTPLRIVGATGCPVRPLAIVDR